MSTRPKCQVGIKVPFDLTEFTMKNEGDAGKFSAQLEEIVQT